MISFEDARSIILSEASVLTPIEQEISEALDFVLAEDVASEVDLPAFDNSAMDGYALRSADVKDAGKESPTVLKVVETIFAGDVPRRCLGPGEAAKIMTGAPLPEGADCVVPVEDTQEKAGEVGTFASAPAGQHVRPQGQELKTGQILLKEGSPLGPAEIGLLAAAGRARFAVYPRPRVAFFVTGDEIVAPGEPMGPGKVRDVNSLTLSALLHETHCAAQFLGRLPDDASALKEAIRKALPYDVLLTSGSVSMGERDLLRECLREEGFQEHFYKINMKPGKPVLFGKLGETLVFCLPGNTVSTMLTFLLLARPALLKMQGHRELNLEQTRARCAVPLRRSDVRQEFLRVKLETQEDALWATPTGDQLSSILSSVVQADGLLIVPAGQAQVDRGQWLNVLLLER